MKLDRTATVARTAHDRTHQNRVVVPEYGVIEIRLEKADKKSKSHLMPGATTRRKPSGKGSDDFAFAPGPQLDSGTWKEDASKTDFPTIIYDIYNPVLAVEKAKLELFSRFSKTPIWTRELKDDELLDGEHKLEINKKTEWDGLIDKGQKGYPDDFVTVEHSPYKLRLTVEGKGVCTSPAAWTYFYVLIAKLELEYGPKEALSKTVAGNPDHRKVLAAVVAQGAKPPGKGTIKVFLESDVFKKGHSMFDNSAFEEYKTMWGAGPEVPLFAKIWIKDSQGKEVLAPRAVGEQKFLWDWESKLGKTGNKFVDRSQNYDQKATNPKGQNCHKDRGGKRPDDVQRVFPQRGGSDQTKGLQDGTFPFAVDPCDAPRTWASYSRGWSKGDLASKTGVIFQPSRMAGDTYQVSVYTAYERDKPGKLKINIADDAPLKAPKALKTTTGLFCVWRRITVVNYVRKTATVPQLKFADIRTHFPSSFLDLVDNSGAVKTMTAGTWNARFTTATGNIANALNKLLVDTAVNQYTSGDAGCYFRTFADWTAQVAASLGISVPAATAQLAGVGINTAIDYAKLICEANARTMLQEIFDPEIIATEGINIFHVDASHSRALSQLADPRGLVDGEAADFKSGTDKKAGYMQYGPLAAYASLPLTPETTAAHEIGHHLFLPHTPDVDGTDYLAHDKDVDNCLMSYNLAKKRQLCGFCRLRLRGWSKKDGPMPNGLQTDGTLNEKT